MTRRLQFSIEAYIEAIGGIARLKAVQKVQELLSVEEYKLLGLDE